jgi:L-iduronidase
LPPGDYSIATLRLDDANGCAFNLWDRWQAPELPTADQFERMRQAGEVSLEVIEKAVVASGLSLDLNLLLPSVTVVLVEKARAEEPGSPTHLRAEPQLGLTERQNMLLTWRPGRQSGLQTFEVLFAPGSDGLFQPVSPATLLSAAFLHAREPGSGRYVVEAKSLAGKRVRSEPLEA